MWFKATKEEKKKKKTIVKEEEATRLTQSGLHPAMTDSVILTLKRLHRFSQDRLEESVENREMIQRCRSTEAK